ncbi:SymE family type I addiction module toxin [Collimonas arenae]|uniref:SymE family type I addiction module toxin n=1 Tax=Collimonas arenae TaxID=279058 RepID=UPI00056DB52B|nr:SymE family type I addiction module toxin [Collimonas arenae]
MAKHDHTRDNPMSKAQDKRERLTVSFYQEEDPDIFWIRLYGPTLKRTGFTWDSKMSVRVMDGCLVITSN